MKRLVYKCKYDGRICDREIPKVNDKGMIIPPKEIDKDKIGIAEHCTCWESCIGCDGNRGLSYCPSGNLEIEYIED